LFGGVFYFEPPCIFKAIVLDKLLYALPGYHGYLTEGQKGVLRRVLDKAILVEASSLLRYYDLDVLAENVQYKLFRHSCQERHCLSHLYAKAKATRYYAAKNTKSQISTANYQVRIR